jgi:hypothetical protein
MRRRSEVEADGRNASERASYDEVTRALLAREGMEEARVRLLSWPQAGPDGVRCQVYVGNTGLFAPDPRWVWWSPVVHSPAELEDALERALRLRGKVRTRERSGAEATAPS